MDFELLSQEPMTEVFDAKKVVADYRKRKAELKVEPEVPPEPIVNQHGDQVAPRMDVDEVLRKSFKDVGK